MVNGLQSAVEEPVCGPEEAGQRCMSDTLPPASQSGVVTATPRSGRGDTEMDETDQQCMRAPALLLEVPSVASWAVPAAGLTLLWQPAENVIGPVTRHLVCNRACNGYTSLHDDCRACNDDM